MKHRVLSEVEFGEVEDGKGSETTMKGFAIEASMSQIVSLEEGIEKTEGIKLFLAGGCKEEVSVIKDEVGSVDGFGREEQEQHLVFCLRIRCGRGGKE